jgi:hypothetical protein
MYEYYNPNPDIELNASDCVVRALSKALDMSWDYTYILLSIQGYIDHDIFASDRVWNNLLYDLGYKRKFLPDTCPHCYTVGDFARDNNKGVYVLGTGKHAVTVANGRVWDSWDSSKETPLYFFEIAKE